MNDVRKSYVSKYVYDLRKQLLSWVAILLGHLTTCSQLTNNIIDFLRFDFFTISSGPPRAEVILQRAGPGERVYLISWFTDSWALGHNAICFSLQTDG